MPSDPPISRIRRSSHRWHDRAAARAPIPAAATGALLVAATLVSTTAAEPPRSILQPAGELAAAAARRPLAGLTASRASDVLREQLALPNGSGLIVEDVAAGSAAERAGLRKHDVLVALDEQWLALPEQLSALLADSDEGTAHRLDIRRAGAAVAIDLGPRTPPQAPAAIPKTDAPAPHSPAAGPRAAAEPFVPPPGARRIGPDAVVLENRDCKLKVYRDSDTFLTVRDARGWLVFNGPISTPEQRSLIPRRVRDRVERLETMLDAVAVEPAPTAPAAQAAQTPPADGSAGPVAEIGLLDVPPIEVR